MPDATTARAGYAMTTTTTPNVHASKHRTMALVTDETIFLQIILSPVFCVH